MQRQLGFNLIEVMVALVVLSIGVLGIAALQTTAIKQSQSAFMRSQANQFAYDIADRMRVNSGVLDQYLDKGAGTQDSDCVSYTGAVSGCSATEMAGHDLFEWFGVIADQLPSGSGRICRGVVEFDPLTLAPDCRDVAGSPVVINVWWDDDRDGNRLSLSVSMEL